MLTLVVSRENYIGLPNEGDLAGQYFCDMILTWEGVINVVLCFQKLRDASLELMQWVVEGVLELRAVDSYSGASDWKTESEFVLSFNKHRMSAYYRSAR